MTQSSADDTLDLEIRIFQCQEQGYRVEITVGGQQEFCGYLAADILPWAPSGDPITDGRRLFDTLLADAALRSAWAEARAQAPQRRIRLRIDAEASELHTLPWELLHEDLVMLSAQASTPFSRYLPIALRWGSVVEERPIRVLVAISAPNDLQVKCDLPQADVALERQALEEALGGAKDIHVDFLNAPVTLERLETELRKGYHVFHFLGHGAFNDQQGQAALYFQDQDGHAQLVKDRELASMLARQGVQPRLVFLAACQSATRSRTDAFLGLAPKLVKVGVPAVVAMQDRVTVATARKFGASFYQRLLEHGQVDLAVNEARSTLLAAGRLDAAVPVLFMRLKSGRLWGKEAEAEEAHYGIAGQQVLALLEPISPPECRGFIGREDELASFAQRLATTHLVVIAGKPGVGKTWLAAALARRMRERAKIFWYAFKKGDGLTALIRSLAGFLAWHGQAELWQKLQSVYQSDGQPSPAEDQLTCLFQKVYGHEYLLCFDNFHLVEDDPLLEPFIKWLQLSRETGQVDVIIATQRLPSFVRQVDVEPLGGLALADTRTLLAKHGLDLPDQAVVDLHRYIDGNATLVTWALSALRRVKHLDRWMNSLSENRDVVEFLRKEVDKGLTATERRVMSALAVLDYPSTSRAIVATLGGESVLYQLSDLVGRFLITFDEGESGPEYTLGPMMQEFYYGLLSQSEQEAMHRRAAEFFETRAPDALRAAFHLYRCGEHARAVQSATSNVWGIINRGQVPALRHVLEQLVKEPLDKPDKAAVLLALGQVYALLGETKLARTCYEAALAQAASLPTASELEARACHGLGELLQEDAPQEALHWLRRGVEAVKGSQSLEEAALRIRIGRVLAYLHELDAASVELERGLEQLPPGPSRLRITAVGNLGIICCARGDLERGLAYYQQVQEIAEAMHDNWSLVELWLNWGYELDTSGRWDEALAQYQQALEEARRLSTLRQQILALLGLGYIYPKQGKVKLAQDSLSECVGIARRQGWKAYLIYAGNSLASIHLSQSEFEAAETWLAEAEQLAQALGVREQLPETYRYWALVRLAQDRPAEALAYAGQSVSLAHEIESYRDEGIGLRVLGQAQWANGQCEAALASFEQSLQVLGERDPYEVALTKVEWAKCLRSSADAERGVALLQEARSVFQQLGAKRALADMERLRN